MSSSIFVFFIIYIQLKPHLSFSLPLQTSLLMEAWRTTAPRRWPGSLPPTQSPTSSARSPSPRLSFERDDHSWSPTAPPRDDQMTARPVIFIKFSQLKLDVNESTFNSFFTSELRPAAQYFAYSSYKNFYVVKFTTKSKIFSFVHFRAIKNIFPRCCF